MSLSADAYTSAGAPPHSPARGRAVASGVVLAAALATIYLPDAGHGFIKDDFVWIARSAFDAPGSVTQLLRAPTGFFRPVVSLSFGLNYATCGLEPLCYGATNFALLLVCAAGVFWLARSLAFPRAAALAAAALWSFNFHGINMAVLWISGRTALLLTACALFAAGAFIRRRYAWSALLMLAAMLSKEEAVALPVILGAWSVARALYQRHRGSSREWIFVVCTLMLPLAVYAALRIRSGALTAATAPDYYKFSFTADRVLSNLAQYGDRSITFPAAVILLFLIVARPPLRQLRLDPSVLTFGLLWLLGGFAITVFLPVRSSLYVCFPSVGVSLIAAMTLQILWRRSPERRRRLAIVGGLILPFALWPVYHSRNGRWIGEAELSRNVLTKISSVAAEARGAPTSIVLVDDRSRRPSLADAFGTLVQPAVSLVVGDGVRVTIDPPPPGAPTANADAAPPERILRLRNDSVEP